MELTVFTDGGSLNNPGEAAIAFVVYEQGKVIHQHGHAIGVASNNWAEYTALITALLWIKNYKEGRNLAKIKVFADSQLMVNQLNGLYKVKNADISQKVFEVRALENEINLPISYTHVLREKNALADSLVKKALGR